MKKVYETQILHVQRAVSKKGRDLVFATVVLEDFGAVVLFGGPDSVVGQQVKVEVSVYSNGSRLMVKAVIL